MADPAPVTESAENAVPFIQVEAVEVLGCAEIDALVQATAQVPCKTHLAKLPGKPL